MKPLYTKKNGTINKMAAVEVTMPASYPASRVTYDGGTVEEMFDGRVLAEVTADGVKTNSQLMDELFAQLDLTKLTRNSVLVDPYNFVFSLNHTGSALLYTCTRVGSSNIIFEGRLIQASGSSNLVAITAAGGTTFNDNSSIAPANGLTFKIYS